MTTSFNKRPSIPGNSPEFKRTRSNQTDEEGFSEVPTKKIGKGQRNLLQYYFSASADANDNDHGNDDKTTTTNKSNENRFSVLTDPNEDEETNNNEPSGNSDNGKDHKKERLSKKNRNIKKKSIKDANKMSLEELEECIAQGGKEEGKKESTEESDEEITLPRNHSRRTLAKQLFPEDDSDESSGGNNVETQNKEKETALTKGESDDDTPDGNIDFLSNEEKVIAERIAAEESERNKPDQDQEMPEANNDDEFTVYTVEGDATVYSNEEAEIEYTSPATPSPANRITTSRGRKETPSNEPQPRAGTPLPDKRCNLQGELQRPGQVIVRKKNKAIDQSLGLATVENWRFDFNAKVEPSEDDFEALTTVCMELLEEIQNCDPSAYIAPWCSKDVDLPIIRESKDFPERKANWRKYFNGFRPRKKGGTVYMQILLCYDHPWETIYEDLAWWLESNGHRMRERQLKAESVERIGSLMFSTRNMDTENLRKEYKKIYNLDIELIWSNMQSSGKAEQLLDKEDGTPRNLRVSCPTDQVTKAAHYFRLMYGAQSTNYPLGIRLRFIPDSKYLLNENSEEKQLRAAVKQAYFLKTLCVVQTTHIAALDIRDKGSKMTLREALMDIKSEVYPEYPLIHSIDKVWNNENARAITCIPENLRQLRKIVFAMVAFAEGEYGEWTKKYFYPAAVEVSQGTKWDKQQRKFFSLNDDHVGLAVDADDDLDQIPDDVRERMNQLLSGDTEEEEPAKASNNECPAAKPITDSESISTFWGGSKPNDSVVQLNSILKPNPPKTVNVDEEEQISDSESVQTSNSAVSFSGEVQVREYAVKSKMKTLSGKPKGSEQNEEPPSTVSVTESESNVSSLKDLSDNDIEEIVRANRAKFKAALQRTSPHRQGKRPYKPKPNTASNTSPSPGTGDS